MGQGDGRKVEVKAKAVDSTAHLLNATQLHQNIPWDTHILVETYNSIQ